MFCSAFYTENAELVSVSVGTSVSAITLRHALTEVPTETLTS